MSKQTKTIDEYVSELSEQLDKNQQKWTFEYFSTPQEENVQQILKQSLTAIQQQTEERVRKEERERLLTHKRNVMNITNPSNIYEAVSVGYIKLENVAPYELASDEHLTTLDYE